MGIKGWNSLLITEGWLPKNKKNGYTEASCLWSSILEDSLGTELSNRIEMIPPDAEIRYYNHPKEKSLISRGRLLMITRLESYCRHFVRCPCCMILQKNSSRLWHMLTMQLNGK
jgi:hypothetical protein